MGTKWARLLSFGITPQHLAAYAAADANGFSQGSARCKPIMDVAQGKAIALASVQTWREITAPA